jgi:hypothetical protein
LLCAAAAFQRLRGNKQTPTPRLEPGSPDRPSPRRPARLALLKPELLSSGLSRRARGRWDPRSTPRLPRGTSTKNRVFFTKLPSRRNAIPAATRLHYALRRATFFLLLRTLTRRYAVT